MNVIEDLFVAEARRQGYQPTSAAMMAAASHYAGSRVTGDFLVTSQGYSIHIRDAVASLRNEMPSGFALIDDVRDDELPDSATLTQRMMHELRQNRQNVMPSDWKEVRARMTGKTAEMMDAAEAKRLA